MGKPELFAARLDRLLRAAGRSQAWLVQHAHLSSSVVSRLIRGDRLPTFEHVAAMAPKLGVSVDDLVAGTDAESRIAEASQFVTRAHFESVHRQLMAAESRLLDLDVQLRLCKQRSDAQQLFVQRDRELALLEAKRREQELEQAKQELEQVRRDLTESREQQRRASVALGHAVADVAVLQGKLSEAQLATEQGDRVRMAAALSGFRAIGKQTAADYLRKE